ncbi:MAG: deoxyribodipyrimidine photo-lyase [Dinoroseobacter sp.]|jgi:deoxyribodipyrimidine photo-lyase
MVTCVWFKRDLRVSDHPALTRAAEIGAPLLALYVVEPDYWRLADTSARQWDFTRECLLGLRDDLAALGVPLVVRIGDAVAVLDGLRTSHGVTRLISHEETGNAWTFARDRKIGAWARAQCVAWQELPQSGVVRRLRGRDGWARQRDGLMGQMQLEAPRGLIGVAAPSDPVPDARDLGMRDDPCPGRQIGGRNAALSALGGFLSYRGRDYRRAMSSPLSAPEACSRISPYVALGVLGVREAAQAGAARKAEGAYGWAQPMKSFEARLAWRDHFMQKLEDEPGIELRCLHRAYEGLRPRGDPSGYLAAWATGQTGVPFVDACMRALIHDGWMTFRMRAMLVSFASYHLWLDWRDTGPILARYFTDYEPGIHWSQMQMQSGTTGINTVRMYNPVKQGQTQDPDGVFTRRWVPELAEVSDRALQEPWKWDGAGRVLGQIYPVPLVDLVAAGRTARDAVWGVRADDGFRHEAAHVVDKHASRKDANGRFVNDRARKPKREVKADPGQMSFDL